jgi:hypothetical protein
MQLALALTAVAAVAIRNVLIALADPTACGAYLGQACSVPGECCSDNDSTFNSYVICTDRSYTQSYYRCSNVASGIPRTCTPHSPAIRRAMCGLHGGRANGYRVASIAVDYSAQDFAKA